MAHELKVDTVICQDVEELQFSSSNDKVNVVHKLLDTFLWQGKWSKNNITTPKERRTFSENRWLFIVFLFVDQLTFRLDYCIRNTLSEFCHLNTTSTVVHLAVPFLFGRFRD